jgi:hypothetical protein
MSETQLSRLRDLDAHPECACPVISAFLRSWNDSLPDGERDTLLRPLVIKLVGTRSTKKIEHRRSLMCADWLVRVQTPAWLRLAKLTEQADLLANLPEITSMAQVPSLRGPIEAVRKDAAAAWAAVGAAARDAARDALRPTTIELQRSALALVERMISCGSAA